MYFCLRVDLDYVPWDTPDGQDFGHGEPAAIINLLQVLEANGWSAHFFASSRVLSAFPTVIDAIAGSGHALDWLCKRPDEFERRLATAKELLGEHHAAPLGMALQAPWNPSDPFPADTGLRFVSSPPGHVPAGLRHFVVETKVDRESIRSGASIVAWADIVKVQIRRLATVNKPASVCIRPQVLGKHDPHLKHVQEIMHLASAIGYRIQTLRSVLNEEPASSRT